MHLIDVASAAELATNLATAGTTATILFAKSWWLQPANLFALAKGIGGLGLVIFVHELGHFSSRKRAV